ncbi:outer membrane beta-barrel protein [Spirosoma sp. BT704]|uniref:Outer membrane beta-barrel protein n=2 Tax=Spirosoma validum TaxID=2771355 RepID=A0A927GFF3_9BACT|nr:outer membrane beta-barrel protein [Spirosoma validum]
MNRNLVLLFSFVILSATQVCGQRNLSVSVTLSPTLAHTNYGNRYFYPESDGQVVEPVYVNGSRWAFGPSVGLSVLYTYAPGWSVSSGIWFQQVAIRQSRQPLAGEGSVTLRKRVFRVPLLLNYYANQQRLSPYFSFGLLTDFPLTSRVLVTRAGESTQNLRLVPLNASPVFHLLLGAGIRYKLTDQYTFMAQPVWTYNFGQLGGSRTHDPSFELSLQTQLAYTF